MSFSLLSHYAAWSVDATSFSVQYFPQKMSDQKERCTYISSSNRIIITMPLPCGCPCIWSMYLSTWYAHAFIHMGRTYAISSSSQKVIAQEISDRWFHGYTYAAELSLNLSEMAYKLPIIPVYLQWHQDGGELLLTIPHTRPW